MSEKGVCDAHGLLLQNLEGLKKGQDQLYNLDREKASEMSEIKLSVARLEESTKSGFISVLHWQENFEENQKKRDAELSITMNKVLMMSSRRRWSPKMIVALIGALIGPSGLAAIFILFVK